ncbi:hypothetical protein BTO02_20375 [Paraburkholderia sp. SOS3]|nr:hypothetical protein BTO02_20375 [Paraburkholderia sp. SOS3]
MFVFGRVARRTTARFESVQFAHDGPSAPFAQAWSSVPLEAVVSCRRIAATPARRLPLKGSRKRIA